MNPSGVMVTLLENVHEPTTGDADWSGSVLIAVQLNDPSSTKYSTESTGKPLTSQSRNTFQWSPSHVTATLYTSAVPHDSATLVRQSHPPICGMTRPSRLLPVPVRTHRAGTSVQCPHTWGILPPPPPPPPPLP